MNVSFPPPLRWQDFEDLTVEVVRSVFDDPGAQGHGRIGQPQAGVDVYGRERGSGRLVGVQCKRRASGSDQPERSLNEDEVRAEVKKAEHFDPKLDYFIVATTGSRDSELQSDIRFLQAERRKDEAFPVALWFWEDFVGFLNADARLGRWYSTLLHGLYGDKLADKQILDVMRTAFSRAAFRTPLNAESPLEFRQALLDTERVVNTGLLLDRESRMPLYRAPGGLIDIAHDPHHRVSSIMNAVQRARIAFDEGVANGQISLMGYCVIVNAPAVRDEIDRHRGDALRSLNDLLGDHGEPLVDSPLLAVTSRRHRKTRGG